jgi:ketosteroid isomerase-like protein
MLPIEIVISFYDALKRGDVPALLVLLKEDLSWTEAEGFPYFSGTWRSPQEVVGKLLVPISTDWDDFVVHAESFVSEADNVVAFGIYRGVNRATGRKLFAPFAHRWRVTDGRISSFVQYTDTVLVRKAMK